jgi:hypothetical protein
MARKPQYDGPYTQQSEHSEGHSGLPIRPDGTLRESSNAVPPIEKKSGKPVNPKN